MSLKRKFDEFVSKQPPSVRNLVYNAPQIAAVGHQLAESVRRVAEKPTKWTLATEAFAVTKALFNFEMADSELFFYNGDWEVLVEDALTALALAATAGCSRTVMTQRNTQIIIVDVDGIEIGWSQGVSQKYPDVVFAHACELELARSKLNDLIVKNNGGKSLLLRTNEDNKIIVEPDDTIDPLPSKPAREAVEYVRRCITAGVHRSQLYYGAPGTGKSTLLRAVTADLGMRTLRIRIEDLDRYSTSAVKKIVELLSPEAIIFDDIDRVGNNSSLLEMLDMLHRTTKFIGATANDKDCISDAILRPGRFDELIEMNSLDDVVILNALGPELEHMLPTVRSWPIAYVHELVLRTKYMSKEDAVTSIRKLKRTVDKLMRKYGDDEDESNEPADAT